VPTPTPVRPALDEQKLCRQSIANLTEALHRPALDELSICRDAVVTLTEAGFLNCSSLPYPLTKYTLEDEFCEVYYTGTGDCAALRAKIHTNDSLAVPFITLGDPSLPPMFFFHGWPDTYALYINQFEEFCMPPHGRFYCIAPSWFDYVPASRTTSPPNWEMQIEAWHSVASDLGLRDITLVAHDFGVLAGFMYMYRYPQHLKRTVILDIAQSSCADTGCGGYYGAQLVKLVEPYGTLTMQGAYPGYILQYIELNACSYLLNNEYVARMNALHAFNPPCQQCESLTGLVGWPYYQFVNSTWPLYTDVPSTEWKFSQVPDLPDIPMLFLYGNGTQDAPRDICFFTQDWWNFLGSNPNGTMAAVEGGGHWFVSEAGPAVNTAMSRWLNSPKTFPKPPAHNFTRGADPWKCP